MSKSKDDAFEVSDSTDWLETPLPSLAPVDSALRCQVCRDFFTTPMITSCSHTFCSLCIRHCLGNDGKCPTCRKEDQASKLKNNYAIEDLVEAFQRARPHVLEYAKKRSEEVVSSLSSKRRRTETEIEDSSSPARKRTRSGRKAQQSSQQIAVGDSDGGDEVYVPEEVEKPKQVLCPICQDGFPTVKAVEAHVDHCDGEPSSKKHRLRSSQTLLPPQPVSNPTKRPERIGQLHYSTVKDNVLRKKLTDLGLSTSGTRQLMERRHTEWVTLWNANCDSKNPKSKGELKKELDIWERTHGGGASAPSRGNQGGSIRDKDFDGTAWARKHDDSFKQLIAEARRKKVATPKAEATSSATPPTIPSSTPHTSPYMPATSTGPAQHSNKSFKNDVPERTYESSWHDHSSSKRLPTKPSQYALPTEGGVNTNEGPSDQSQLQGEPQSEIIPASPLEISSQRRFFKDNTVPFQPPPLSQHPNTRIPETDMV